MMKHVTLLTLLVFAPLSWGEDVWYCAEEIHVKIEEDVQTRTYGLEQYKVEKFTMKYEADKNRLSFIGKSFSGSKPFYMECVYCNPTRPYFRADKTAYMFVMQDDRFHLAGAMYLEASMTTGTCTKF